MIGGRLLLVVVVGLAAWCLLLCGALWKALQIRRASGRRGYINIAGLICATVAVGSLMALHLSWSSANLSQRLGVGAIRVLGYLLLWPTIVGLVLCITGNGRIRFAGIVSSLATGLWWLFLAISAGITMGVPMARHPTRFLIPKGYVGWVEIQYREHAPPLPMINGNYVCRIPESGSVATSSPLEEGWANDEYFYYSDNGAYQLLPNTGWGGGGMIWAESVGTNSSKPGRIIQRFYVGKEDQFRRDESHPKPKATSTEPQPNI